MVHVQDWEQWQMRKRIEEMGEIQMEMVERFDGMGIKSTLTPACLVLSHVVDDSNEMVR